MLVTHIYVFIWVVIDADIRPKHKILEYNMEQEKKQQSDYYQAIRRVKNL